MLPKNVGKMFLKEVGELQTRHCFTICKAHKRSWDIWGAITRDLQKAGMDGSRWRNEFKQNHTSEGWHKYKRLRNKCADLLKRQKILC